MFEIMKSMQQDVKGRPFLLFVCFFPYPEAEIETSFIPLANTTVSIESCGIPLAKELLVCSLFHFLFREPKQGS